MNKAARSILQRIGPDSNVDNQRNQIVSREVEEAKAKLRQREAADEDQSTFEAIPEEMLTESEKRHAKHRRQQAQAGRFTPAADRLPIMSKEERENFKIKEYLIYLKKFWNKLLLYNSLLTISSYFFFDELGVVIVYSISLMLPLPIFIYQSNKNFKK